MRLTPTTRVATVTLIGVLLATASESRAGLIPPANIVVNPTFTGQSSTFQNAPGGPYAADWTYTGGFDFFGQGDLVSQSLTTADLHFYDISFDLGTIPNEGEIDFGVDWNGNFIDFENTLLSDQMQTYDFTVLANGTSSDFGFVGNTAFWSSVSDLKIADSGNVDLFFLPNNNQNVPEGSIGLGLQSFVFLGICGLAAIYRRPEQKLARVKAS